MSGHRHIVEIFKVIALQRQENMCSFWSQSHSIMFNHVKAVVQGFLQGIHFLQYAQPHVLQHDRRKSMLPLIVYERSLIWMAQVKC